MENAIKAVISWMLAYRDSSIINLLELGSRYDFVNEFFFRPKTTSKSVSVRVFYFLFSVAMYNLWILLNLCVGLRFKGKIPEKPIITAKMFIKEIVSSKIHV